MIKYILLIIGGIFAYTCFSHPPSELPSMRYNDIGVNVWVHFPDAEKDHYVGRTMGIAACTRMAYHYAASVGWGNSMDWTYYCCTIEGGSECFRKIR